VLLGHSFRHRAEGTFGRPRLMLERIMKKWVEVPDMDTSGSGQGPGWAVPNTNEPSGSNRGKGNLTTAVLA
jgi:hypothetical protein